jgi:hypothetical protein
MGTNALPLGQPLPQRAAVLVAEAMAGRRPVEADLVGWCGQPPFDWQVAPAPPGSWLAACGLAALPVTEYVSH